MPGWIDRVILKRPLRQLYFPRRGPLVPRRPRSRSGTRSTRKSGNSWILAKFRSCKAEIFFQLKKFRGWLLAGVLFLALSLAPASPASGEAVSVIEDSVNLRSGPGTGFPVLGQTARGQTMTVLGSKNGWYQVKTAHGPAWIAGFLVERDYSSELVMAKLAETVNLRSGPGTDYVILGRIGAGASVRVVGESGQWYKVRLPGGDLAWVAGWLVSAQKLGQADLAVTPIQFEAVAAGGGTQVRGLPVAAFDLEQTAPAGTRMRVLESSGEFYRVSLPNGTTGWVQAPQIQLLDPSDKQGLVAYSVGASEWEIRSPATAVMTDLVNLRTGAGLNQPSVDKLKPGTPVRVIDQSGEWLRIATADRRVGWVHSAYAPVRTSGQASSILLRRETPQTKTLTITGSFDQPGFIHNFDGGKTLGVFLGSGIGPAWLPVNAGEVGVLTSNQRGVTLSFRDRARYTIIENNPGKIKLRLFSSVDSTAVESLGDREALILQVSGQVQPAVTYNQASDQLVMVFPDTSYLAKSPPAPGRLAGSISFQAVGRDLKLVASGNRGRFLLRRSEGRIVVEFLAPGLKDKVIILDPGHGGWDPGAVGPQGQKEKTVNLKVALKLRDLLQPAGAKVIMTRSDDNGGTTTGDLAGLSGHDRLLADLSARARLSNSRGSDLFISIHSNSAASSRAAGTSTYYSKNNLNADRSQTLARLAQTALLSGLKRSDQGVRAEDYYVIRNVLSPSALVEMAYLSNPEEERLLSQDAFQTQAASSLFAGLQEYFR